LVKINIEEKENCMKTLVIMPTYNEIESLERSVLAIRHLEEQVDLLIVDDNSPDGTGQLADSLTNQTTYVLHRSAKDGLGAAYLDAFGWAISHGYELIVQMDADGSHLANDLPKLLARSHHADLVIGSRWVPGGSVENWPWYRKAISKIGNSYARFMLRSNVRDMTAGYRVYKATFLKTVDLSGVASRGYAFQVEMTLRTMRARGVIVEVPITFVERIQGASKMTTAIVLEALWLVTKWAFYKSA
jgi:dolichol-phosphate mannosyltransferase